MVNWIMDDPDVFFLLLPIYVIFVIWNLCWRY